jgi:hypothetical protein
VEVNEAADATVLNAVQAIKAGLFMDWLRLAESFINRMYLCQR